MINPMNIRGPGDHTSARQMPSCACLMQIKPPMPFSASIGLRCQRQQPHAAMSSKRLCDDPREISMSEQARFMLVASPLMQNSPAFDRAAALAKAEGAALHIVAFDYLEGLATAGMVNEQALEQMRLGYVERHRQWLEEQARPLRKIGVTVTTEVVWVEKPLQEILIHIKEHPMAVLIKALEHESLLSRLMFTPLDIHLLRECPVPLHFVSHVQHALPRRIVAAVDPFHHDGQYKGFNDRILREAVKLASACNAQVDVIYAHDLSSIGADEFGFDNASAYFSSSNAKTLFDAQGQAFNDLAALTLSGSA
jgi:universal stress protein E